jgi:hypothetical protein
LFNEQWVIDKINEVIKRFLEINENENTTYRNLWDTARGWEGEAGCEGKGRGQGEAGEK